MPDAAIIYLDHAAATPCAPQVVDAMRPFWSEHFGNPSSLYALGTAAHDALWQARQQVAVVLNAQPREIVFCGSGTESANLAIFGVAQALRQKGRYILTSAIEHHAVLAAVDRLEKEGYAVTRLPVDEFGRVQPQAVAKALRPDTVLVSVMYANNEIGTIQDIAAIGKICRAAGVIFHTDACQAAGALPLDVRRLHVDLLTINGSKLYGPKGTGALYVRQGTPLQAQLVGGDQEFGLRAGTENIAGWVGLATALTLAEKMREKETTRLRELRDAFWQDLQQRLPDARLNGHPVERLPNNLHVSIPGIEGEVLAVYLAEQGICVSTGSACDVNRQTTTSHVVSALGVADVLGKASVRFTLGRSTTAAQLATVAQSVGDIVKLLRSA